MQSRIVKGDQIQDEFWPSQGNIFGPADARHQADQNEHHLPHFAAEGLRPDAAEELTNTFRRIRLLADYYYNYCDWAEVCEHETCSFLVLPLLLSLGWAERKLKVEFPVAGGKIDIAGFTRSFHKITSKCSLIVETKGFATGLDFAP